MRAAEARLEALRADHYAAGDALHEKQGAFYAANAEVTRLEQQLAFAREIGDAHHAAGRAADRGAGRARRTGDRARRRPRDGRAALEAALTAREAAAAEEAAAHAALPALEADVADARAPRSPNCSSRSRRPSRASASRKRAATARRRRSAKLADRRDAPRRGARRRSPCPPPTPCARSRSSSREENADLAGKQQALAALQASVEDAAGTAARRPPTPGSGRAAGSPISRRASRRCPRCRRRSATARTSTAGWPTTGSRARAASGSWSTSSRAGKTRSRPCCASA